VVRLYRELLADFMLRPRPLAYDIMNSHTSAVIDRSLSAPLQIFLRVANKSELLFCLCWAWEEAYV
jgi:hypothetical protein